MLFTLNHNQLVYPHNEYITVRCTPPDVTNTFLSPIRYFELYVVRIL